MRPRGTPGTRLARRSIAASSVLVPLALLAGGCIVVKPAPVSGPASYEPAPGPSIVEVSPAARVASIGDPEVFLATIRDDGGRPVPGVAVEWVVVAGSVGGIQRVDGGHGRRAGAAAELRAASSETARAPYDVTHDGRSFPVGVGQTWCIVTSSEPGGFELLAYAPVVSDRLWGEARAACTWVDAAWEWPLDATSSAGMTHTLVTRVMRPVDGHALAGYGVTYELLEGGTEATLEDGARRVDAVTDESGAASAALTQRSAVTGWIDVRVTISAPRGADGTPARVLATHVVRKSWTHR